MSTSLRQLFVSMEDDTLNETDLVVSPDETVEQEIADTAESFAEAEQGSDDVQELGEISEGLESIVLSMESAMQDGGLNPQAALFMQHAVQGYTRRLGLHASQITPSLESFGGASGQAAATTISMEGIGETLKKIWVAIKNAVSKAIQAVKNFFAKIFGGVAKLKTRSDALKKAVAELEKEEGDKMNVPNANTLRYKGKADIGSIVAGLKATKAQGESIYGNVVQMASGFYSQAVAKVLNRGELNDEGEAEIKKALEEAGAPLHTVFEKMTQVTNVCSGDAVFRTSGTTNVEKDSQSGVTVPALVKGYGFKAIDDAHTEIDAPKKQELLSVLSEADGLIAQMEGKKKSLEGLSKAREDALKATERKVEGWAAKLKEGGKQALAGLIMRKVNMDVTRPVNQFYSHEFNVVRAALALVDRGVAAHKKGPGKKKAA
ncbi:phiKZ-like phage internal head protein [compost metagenome]